ncbi:MAG: hypothetical protein WHS86_10675 [Desulfosoma sp.]
MSGKRSGEKVGWTGGWMGGFLWVFVLSLVFFHQRRIGPGFSGLLLCAAAVAAVMSFAPWRHPSTPYWKLMLAPYGVFLAAVVWVFWAFGGMKNAGLSWWNLLWLIPLLSPFGMMSRRKWAQHEGRQPALPAEDADPPGP